MVRRGLVWPQAATHGTACEEMEAAAIAAICDSHDVEWGAVGGFGTPDRERILRGGDGEVGRIAMEFMHDGVPMPLREAVWDPEWAAREAGGDDVGVEPSPAVTDVAGVFDMTATLLGHPNLASKAWIVRQYDHEVQGGSVVKPFVGPNAGPGDAAVIRPVPDRPRGLAIGHGLATGLARDPYVMGLAAIDECGDEFGSKKDPYAVFWKGCPPARPRREHREFRRHRDPADRPRT